MVFEIPPLSFGTYLIPPEETEDLVLCALNCGYRNIDTASGYGNEREVASAVRRFIDLKMEGQGEGAKEGRLRELGLSITSKVAPWDMGFEKTSASIEASLNIFRSTIPEKEVKLFHLLHWPGDPALPPSSPLHRTLREGSWKVLSSKFEEGELDAVGVSNFSEEHLEGLEEMRRRGEEVVLPMINQVEMHVFCQQKSLREFCRKKGIVLQAYSPFGQGNAQEILQNATLNQIAENLEISVPRLIFSWILDGEGGGAGGIAVKSSKKERILENMENYKEKVVLPEEILKKIDILDQKRRMTWGDLIPENVQ